MIIRWKDDDGVSQLIETEGFSAGVSEVLRAHRMGMHLLVIDRTLAVKLSNLPLAQHEKALLTRLAQEYTQTGRLHEFSTAYLSVSNSLDGQISVDGSSVIIPFGTLIRTRALDRPALLVENSSADGWLYNEIIRYASEKSGRGNISLEVVHGGGTTTPSVLDALIAEGRIVCALVDSDKDCPRSSESLTLSKLRKAAEKSGWPLARVGSPPARELENVLPIDLVIQLSSAVGNPTNGLLLNILEAEIRSATHSADMYMSYFDLKLGQSSVRLEGLRPDAQEWISAKLSMAGHQEGVWSIGGYGENMISQVSSSGYLISELRKLMSGSLWRSIHWGFFSFFAWFFVSARRVVT